MSGGPVRGCFCRLRGRVAIAKQVKIDRRKSALLGLYIEWCFDYVNNNLCEKRDGGGFLCYINTRNHRGTP
jgi:hypothetical protein